MSKATTVLCLSALVTASIYLGYPSKGGLWLTAGEVEAAKYINSTTNEPYVVVSYEFFKLAGYAVVGAENPVAYYYRTNDYGYVKRLFGEVCQGSAEALIEAAKANTASIAFFVISKQRSPDADSVIELLSERPDFDLYGIFGDDIYVFRYIIPSEFIEQGTGPSVYISTLQKSINTTFVANRVTFEAEYVASLIGSNNYSLTNWPIFWSFEKITPEPTTKSIEENFLSFTGREDVQYNVAWTANFLYQNIGWKDDSFTSGWTLENSRGFLQTPILQTDGDVLTITGNFQSGSREFYWTWKEAVVSTDQYPIALVRWRSTSTCALAWAYYTDGSNQGIVTYGSYSADWTTTIVRLAKGKTIYRLMVGLDDFRADTAGLQFAYFDFIMLANTTRAS